MKTGLLILAEFPFKMVFIYFIMGVFLWENQKIDLLMVIKWVIEQLASLITFGFINIEYALINILKYML